MIRKPVPKITRCPVPKRTGLVKHDVVQLLHKDRKFECAYAGQTALVLKPGQVVTLLLRCGHLWDCPVEGLKKIGHKEPEVCHHASSIRRG